MAERDYGRPEGWDESPYVPEKEDLDKIGRLTITPDEANYLFVNGIADRTLTRAQRDALHKISEMEGPDVEGDLVKELREVYKEQA